DTMGAQRRGFLLYADVKRGLQQVVPMATAGSDRARAEVEQYLALSGFDKVEALAIADIPAGTGYRSELALTMSERTGFLAVLESGAADHRFAKHVPRDALLYAGEKSDLAGLWDRALAWMATIDPRVGQKIQESVAHLNRELGLDLRRELLGSLGDQWGVYVDTPPGGGLIPDLVLFASLRDRARAERTIDLLVARLSDAAASDHITLKRGATEFRGTTIHYLALSHGDEPIPIMPAWAFGEDYCISALYPQSIKHALMEKPSLASNPRFRLLRETAPAGATSLTYVDSPRIAGWLYNTIVPILQGTQGAINHEIGKWGVQLNFHDLPPASVITRHMQAGGMYWVCGDDHLRLGTVSSFPGTLLAIPATAMLAASVMYVSRVEHHAPFVRELEFEKALRPVPAPAPPDARYRELAERMGRLEAEIAQLRKELERANK
ncbi:MAG: DUF3352 domain-containing protein, partial [Planctomycetota bacterium]|nr:DUF3352 domain-containing protein [Planctomycetota bacterium]